MTADDRPIADLYPDCRNISGSVDTVSKNMIFSSLQNASIRLYTNGVYSVSQLTNERSKMTRVNMRYLVIRIASNDSCVVCLLILSVPFGDCHEVLPAFVSTTKSLNHIDQ